MRPGPATQTAFVRGFLLALSPRGGGMTPSARQRFNEEVPPLPKPFARFAILIANPQPLRRPLAFVPLPAPKSQKRNGRRPQSPGNQFRTRARHLEHPPATHSHESPACRWPCRNHSARSGTLTFSMNPLSSTLSRPATQKPSPLVQNLWTMCLPCGTPRKSKNKFPRPIHSQASSITYTP